MARRRQSTDANTSRSPQYTPPSITIGRFQQLQHHAYDITILRTLREDFEEFGMVGDLDAQARGFSTEHFEREMSSDQFKAAEKSLVKAVDGYAKMYGPKQPTTLPTIGTSETIRSRIKEYDEQEQHHLKATTEARAQPEKQVDA